MKSLNGKGITLGLCYLLLVLSTVLVLNSCGNKSSYTVYDQATLYVYLCPDFFTCNPVDDYVVVQNTVNGNNSCKQLQNSYTGCESTGIIVNTDQNYTIMTCTDCSETSCSSPGSFYTPNSFGSSIYYAETYFYCNTPCYPSSTCQ